MTINLMNILTSLVEEIAEEMANEKVRLKSGLTREAALAAATKPGTDGKTLAQIFSDYGGHLDIAQAIAVHPNASSHSLQTLFLFLPDDVRKNPSYEAVSSEGQWQRNVSYLLGDKLKGRSNSFSMYAVSKVNPSLYKAAYYLEHGAPEDFRHVASIEAIPNDLLRPFLTGKNSNKRKILASRKNFDAADYELLAKDSAKTVRLALASNPAVPVQVVETLLNDKDEAVRRAAADNPVCPPELAHTTKMAEANKPTLADMPVGKLKADDIMALLRDSATPTARIDELAKHDEPTIRYACGLHPNVSPELCNSLINAEPAWLAESVAWNPGTPVKLLEKLAENGTEGVRLGLAYNPATPEAVQLEIAESGTDGQRYGLANTTEHDSVWAKLAEQGDARKAKKDQQWVDHLAIALDPKSKAGQLLGLQRYRESRHTFVGRLIARHPNCPPSLVSQYAYYCYAELAHNPKFALQILEDPDAIRGEPVAPWKLAEWVSSNGVSGHVADFYLQSDDETNRRRSAAAGMSTLSLLQPMALHPDTKLRSALAARGDLTRFMYEQLGRDKNNKTREAVAKNLNCPTEVLAMLASDKTATVRAGATQNRNYDASRKKGGKAQVEQLHDRGPLKSRIKMADDASKAAVLADLAQDKEADVREAVARNECTTSPVLTKLAEDPESQVRCRIPYHPNTPPKVIRALLEDDDNDVRYAAVGTSLHMADYAKRTKEVAALVERAAKDVEVRIRAAAAEFAADVGIQQRLADEDEMNIRRKLAANRQLDLQIAKRLLASDEHRVRDKVIQRLSDLDTLRDLLDHPEDKAYSTAICNPLVFENADEFVDHPNKDVRSHLAYRIDELPAEFFDRLVKYTDRYTQEYLATAKKMDRERVEKLLDVANPSALWKLSARDKLNKEDVLRLANHDDMAVREIAASNHEIDDDVFERFLSESDEFRDHLRYNKKLTREQKARLKEVT